MPVVHVDSLDDPRLDVYARLTEAQLRNRLEPEKGIFIAESGKVIERAFAGGMEPLSLLMEEKWLESTAGLIAKMEAAHPDLPVFVAPHEQLERLTGFELTRGALGAFRRPALPRVEEIVRDAHLVAVLENITNHTNVGAIFRSAAALGVDAVLVTPACYDPLYRRAVRVSMGTVFQVPWARIGCEDDGGATPAAESGHDANRAARAEQHGEKADCETSEEQATEDSDANRGAIECKDARSKTSDPGKDAARNAESAPEGGEAIPPKKHGRPGRPGDPGAAWAEEGIPLLKSLGFTTAAMALSDDSVPLDDARLNSAEKVALVFGTEGDGLAQSTIDQCDYTVRIPMAHGVDSLNVAAASAVAFWQFRR